MNIIVLVIDTLRYDAIAWHGVKPWMHTPNLDRLAASSLVFDRAFAASYPTFPHRTDVVTGTCGDPFNPWMPLAFDVPTMPRLLADAGYATQLIHDTPVLVNGGASFDWPFHAWTHVRGASTDRPWIDDRPFELLENWVIDPALDPYVEPDPRVVVGHQVVTYLRANRGRHRPEDWNAAKLFLAARDFLRDNRNRDRFFLWLDCFDPHEPWDAPPELVQRYDATPGYDGRVDPRLFEHQWWKSARREPLGLPDALIARLKAMYAAKVSLVDQWLGVFLDALEETGLRERTALVVTADHGTCLGDFGTFGKRIFTEVGEPEGHVPLMVAVPGLPPNRSIATVQPQDIFTTVLDIAGLPATAGRGEGTSLLRQAGRPGRDVALMGAAPCHGWKADPCMTLLTVFADGWCLHGAADPGACRLHRLGSERDEAAEQPSMVAGIRERAFAELRRRGTDSRLVEWFETEGRAGFPEELMQWPGTPKWAAYWDRLYNRW